MLVLRLATLTLLVFGREAVEEEEDQYPYLPKTVRPIRYRLTFEAHPDKDLSFSGTAIIEIKVLKPTRNVTLHSKDLTIEPSSVQMSGTEVESVRLKPESDLCVVSLRRELKAGARHQLIFKHYVGSLNHEKSGFFLAKYRDGKGDERNIALTFFEPHGARLAFPCFDEPALKAKFVVSLIRSTWYHSVANAELLRTIILGGGRVMDVYKETVTMSTYLVAFAILDFSYTNVNGRVRVLARKDAIRVGSADYVLDESARLLKAMEEYTGVNYALDKVDLLAVPSHYFVDGAMENWGLITYSEDHLLYSKNESSIEDLQRCTTYTAHELAHQWFGNLVTPSKWNYLWLSEGFASYFQFYLADIVEPTWRLKEQFVIDQVHSSLSSDLEPMAQSINYVFPNADDFPSAWSYYYKASSVIRMIEHFVTSPVFRRGLKMYLEKKKFSSSTPEDLYECFQKSLYLARAQHLLGTLTVSQICSTWNNNIGYPLVTVSRNYTDGTITLTQETYNTNEDATDSTWIIPINYATNSLTDFSKTTADFWLTEKSITFNHFKTVNWIILNKQHAGYFRVNYDAVNWNRLSKFLRTSKFRTIHVLNRAQLINDAFHMLEDGKLSASIAMDLSVYVKQETDYVALKPFVKHMDSLDFMMSTTDQYNTFKTYVKHVLNMAFTKVGLEENLGDSHIDKLQRVLLAKKMCLYGDRRCQSFGLENLRLWSQTGSLNVWSEIEGEVLCGGVQVASESDWDFLLEQFRVATDKRQRLRYIEALGCSQDPKIAGKYFDFVYDFQNDITESDRVEALLNVVESRVVSIEFVLDYLISKSMTKNSSFEEAVAGATIHQIVSTKLTQKVEALADSGNDKYIPTAFFTEEQLEEYEVEYISQVAQWLLESSNFVR